MALSEINSAPIFNSGKSIIPQIQKYEARIYEKMDKSGRFYNRRNAAICQNSGMAALGNAIRFSF
jgi:hypothetical protein